MKIHTSMTELVGATPLLELARIEKDENLGARVLAKLEYFNPAGSVKDRIALQMLNEAEKSGTLKAGGTIIEPTSGNTGIGLAAISAARGYKFIAVMPDTMSLERRALIKAYGAQIVLTPGKDGMKGALTRAEALNREIPGSILAGQFVNPANPDAHRVGTGPEIFADTGGLVDIFVAGVGTGGTITGVGEFLKAVKPSVEIVAVEPESSPVLSGGCPGAHKIQGIGAGFVPKVLNTAIYDRVMPVPNENAMATARLVAETAGVLVGISSGAAAYAAIQLAKQPENRDKVIVALFPDNGERYLSTSLYE